MNFDIKKIYMEQRNKIEGIFVSSNLVVGTHISVLSPSGKYRLDINQYYTGKYGDDYLSRGEVTRTKDEEIIADVKRTDANFWYVWINHTNGDEYLLCGEHPQTYSIINLTKATTNVYFSEASLKDEDFYLL